MEDISIGGLKRLVNHHLEQLLNIFRPESKEKQRHKSRLYIMFFMWKKFKRWPKQEEQ